MYYTGAADKTLPDGGPLRQWHETRDGLTTYAEIVLYCYLKSEEEKG